MKRLIAPISLLLLGLIVAGLVYRWTSDPAQVFLTEKCPRYGKARPMLDQGVPDTADMLKAMKAMRITGPGRSLWISVMDLNARSIEVRYFKEFERKYEFGF